VEVEAGRMASRGVLDKMVPLGQLLSIQIDDGKVRDGKVSKLLHETRGG
tara:strand:- start:217 stop:363 length:147 start_codon:yes stop_codon:yes gene_type:complete